MITSVRANFTIVQFISLFHKVDEPCKSTPIHWAPLKPDDANQRALHQVDLEVLGRICRPLSIHWAQHLQVSYPQTDDANQRTLHQVELEVLGRICRPLPIHWAPHLQVSYPQTRRRICDSTRRCTRSFVRFLLPFCN